MSERQASIDIEWTVDSDTSRLADLERLLFEPLLGPRTPAPEYPRPARRGMFDSPREAPDQKGP